MAIVELNKIGLFTSVRKKLNRDITIYPEYPYKGGGFKAVLESGIYQMRRFATGFVCVREKFYTPTNPQTELQQANRSKFSDGVASWQALTLEQKKIYNKRAIGKHMSGYNLFLREYMYD